MKHAIPQRYAIPHRYATRPGLYFTEDGGADVIVRSETADQVWLCIYEKVDQPTAFFNDAIRIFDDSATPFINEIHEHAVCTRIIEPMYVRETLFRMDGPNYGLWYVHLPKAWDGMRYAYRVDGAWDPSKGLRFNPYKLLLDPYGKGIDGRMKLSPAAFSYQCDVSEDGKVRGSAFGPMSTVDALGNMPVSVAIDDRDKTKHDADPSHPHVPWSKTVLYELHVKGFTANAPWLPKELRGTYAGLAHPTTLSYLQSLGVTSIELLPIQAKQDELFLQERGRHNYWGYSPLSYFSPEPSYATAEAQRKGARAVRDEVIGMDTLSPNAEVLTVTAEGYGKRTETSEYRAQNRGGKGLINLKVTEKTGDVIGLRIVHPDQELMLITTEGIVIRTNISDISVISRNTQGVKLMSTGENDIVASMAVMDQKN